jgi:formyltetrahydrofolate deformylase
MSDATRPNATAVLLVTCPDRKGVVASIAEFIYRHNGNILHADEHGDADTNLFLMRVEWDLAGFGIEISDFAQHFAPVAQQFQMQWRVATSMIRPRVAIMVSRLDHCLGDLLYRHKVGELACEIPLIISNHPDAEALAAFYRVPFHYVPVPPSEKCAAEREQLKLLRDHGVDLVVLARYMQILSPDFISAFPDRIINIHHSFLPAFVGANPYQAAYDRGVKLIGATAHYVTEELDAGPIIEQDVLRIDHRHDPDDLRRLGRYIERVVLARAVGWHCEDRVLLHGNKTIVFN